MKSDTYLLWAMVCPAVDRTDGSVIEKNHMHITDDLQAHPYVACMRAEDLTVAVFQGTLSSHMQINHCHWVSG